MTTLFLLERTPPHPWAERLYPCRKSVKLDTGSFHDLADPLEFVLQRAIKFLRTAASWLNSHDSKLADDIGLLHDCICLRSDFLHGRSRCSGAAIDPHYR